MNDKQLTKRSARLFRKSNINKQVDTATYELNSARYTDCHELLLKCQDMYDRMQLTREKMRRATNYTFGRQWEDKIKDPDSPYSGAMVKEEEYIKRQGKVPLKYNIIRKSEKAIVGLFRNNRQEPVAIARDRDEQKLGEMMTVMMQYTYQINDISELNARLLEYCFCTGLFIRSCYYRYNYERQIADVFVQNENPYKIFFNDTVQDTLMRDLSMIGAIRDMTIKDLISAFATNAEEAKELADEYKTAPTSHLRGYDDTFSKDKNRVTEDFFTPSNPNLCRVYEVWTKESEECYYCHDTAKGEEEFRPLSDKSAIDAENERRIAEMISLGYSAEDASLINYKWTVRQYWYVRYLTPLGKCIKEGESPFEHGSHPFTIGAYPMMDGEIFSPAEELIDIQRVINRTLSQIDFMRQNGAKNVLMCPIDAVPDNMSPRDFATEYTRNGSVLFYKPNPNGTIPTQLKSQSVQAGDIDIINLYLQLNDQISGISGALKGEQAKSSTPAALYAQEAQNSSNNIADFLGWFNTCIRQSDYKIMEVIAQYTDDKRYIPIAGKNFSEEAKWYTPEKIRQTKFDLTMVESASTPTYRMAQENILFEALKNQFIDFKTFLETSSAPFADNLLEIIKRHEQDAQAQGTPLGQGLSDQMQGAIAEAMPQQPNLVQVPKMR